MSGDFKKNEWSPGSLTPVVSQVLEEVRRELAWRYGGEEKTVSSTELSLIVKSAAARVGLELSSFERDEVIAHIESDASPFSILQPLIDDISITDIIVSSYCKITVQQARRNFHTSISFADRASYEGFVERLLNRANTVCSTKQPIADGMIGSYVRIHVVHQSLCEDGPYLTIRINRFSSVGLKDLIESGLAPLPVFKYLEAVLANGRTLLIGGEVGTGKTTLARALAGAVPSEESILVIEDTPEIRLNHPHVRYVVTRSENFEGEGKIAPAQCIRAGMRMAMNRIIFGEIRDAEAAEAFVDVCASGHPGLSTIHARSASEAVARMELFLGRAQRGVDHGVLISQIATSIQVVCIVDLCRVTGKRRLMEVREIGPVADGVMRHREIFRYSVQDGFPRWTIVSKVSAHREALEKEPYSLHLGRLSDYVELDPVIIYRERGARSAWN